MVETSEISGITPEVARNLQTKALEVEGNKIRVQWKEFFPTKERQPTDEAVIFLPGWSAGRAKTIEELSQNFAENSGQHAYSVTTRAEQVIPNSLYQEAKAVRQFIQERGLRKVTLAGHSEGGAKAVNLIDILQRENPDIDVRGLILVDPVGLYGQGNFELTRKFTQDSMFNTPLTFGREVFRNPVLIIKGLQASTDIVFNIGREIVSSNIGYMRRLLSQIREMASANAHFKDIKSPVVLIQGSLDPVSSAERVIPKAERPEALSERRKILQETFFPNGPRVDMLVPKKVGHHGLPHFRSDEVARVSLYLLDRYWRST